MLRQRTKNARFLSAAVACGILAVTVSAAIAQPAGLPAASTGKAQVFTAADILNLKQATDVQISPDGRWIAFVVTAVNVRVDRLESSLWIVDARGGQTRRLVQGEASEPRWSPDSASLAYLAADAQGRTQVMVIDRGGERPVALTHLPEAPDALAWAPDGRAIAFTAFVPGQPETLGAVLPKPKGATWAPPLQFTTAQHVLADGTGFLPPGHTHIFMVLRPSGAVRQLTSGSSDDSGPAWSSDSRYIVFSAKPEVAGRSDLNADRIMRLDVSTGASVTLSPDPIQATAPVFSPDGKFIAFVGYVEQRPGALGTLRIYVMNRDGSHTHVLSPALDRLQSQPAWTSDGRAVLAAYADRSIDEVGRLGLDGSIQVLAKHSSEGYSLARDGAVGFSLSGSDHPADVGIATTGGQRRLTSLNAPLLDGIALGATRPLAVRSTLDGAEVGAWLVLPPHYDPAHRYPLILDIHGGPYFYDGPDWDTDAQVFAGAGYVVLHANYRGSTSYGASFSAGADFDFPGNAAYADLMSAVDASIAAGVADPNRLFVTGGSAGGEMTAWIVGKTHRFRAAAAAKPSVNFIGASLESDQYAFDAIRQFGVTPWRSPMTFWAHSPLSMVGEVTTPTLLIVGEEDRRTPLGQSLEFYNALQIRGVPTGLIHVPGASHESLESRPSQHAAEVSAILAWFHRYDHG